MEEDLPDDFALAEAINSGLDYDDLEDNFELDDAIAEAQDRYGALAKKKFCDMNIAPTDLVGESGHAVHGLDGLIIEAFRDCKAHLFKDTDYFMDKGDGSLYSADGILYIKREGSSAELRSINEMAKDPSNARLFSDADITDDDIESIGGYKVQDAFLRFLAKHDSWEDFADGAFEEAMVNRYDGDYR